MDSSSSSSISTATTTTVVTSTAAEVNGLDVIQSMIDISADRLEGLRTQCATSASLTQQEIRSLETKLVRMFSELLITKAKLPERIPSSGLAASGAELKQWLRVVGLSQESLNVCLHRLNTLEQLLEKSDAELRDLLISNPNYREEEVRRLTCAMHNLKKCKNTLHSSNEKSENLFWDSWDRHHHTHYHHKGISSATGSNSAVNSPRSTRIINKQGHKLRQSPVSSSGDDSSNAHIINMQQQQHLPSSTITTSEEQQSPNNSSSSAAGYATTISPSPPTSPFTVNLHTNTCGVVNQKLGQRKSGTPPPKKKHQTLFPYHPSTPSHIPMPSNTGASTPLSTQQQQDSQQQAMTKSKSHESQLTQDAQLLSTGGGTVVVADNGNATQTTIVNTNPSSQQFQLVQHVIPRTRLHTEPGPDLQSHVLQYNIESPENTNNLTVPRSPCTPIVSLGMGHMINHRFTKVFKVMSTCDLCQKQMFFGLKCKECKYRCHKDCEPNVPPSCGLPREFVDEFKKTLQQSSGGDVFLPPPPNTSPNLGGNRNMGSGGFLATAVGRRQKGSSVAVNHNTAYHHAGPDSSSPGSSCNSSSPSSPALFNVNQSYYSHSSSQQSNQTTTPSSAQKHSIQFNFPDVSKSSPSTATGPNQSQQSYLHHHHHYAYSTTGSSSSPESYPLSANINNVSSSSSSNCNTTASITNSHHLVSSTGSIMLGGASYTMTAAAKMQQGLNTVTQISSGGNQIRPPLSELSDTHKSNDSDKTVSLSGSTSASTDSDRTPVRLDSTEEGDSGNWPRQNSLSLKEWDIPYDDLRLLEKIGKGRFGTVHRALWHGDVAVKLLKEDYLDDEKTLEAFKLEVATFKKTRHENLVLFMGACMNPPFLAIVTSLCKGNTLYTYIHLRRDKFNLSRTTLVAQQISQGMGYLHARGIFHKDLRTKNIFLENGKVIITDFGLFSSTKLLYSCDLGLGIPNGWLCYLAPELIRALTPYRPTDEILPFSRASDVYSFGTVWYELLCGEFPFKLQPPESIIWQVGRGMKQTLANIQTSRDVKDILMLCWSFQADDRPDFAKLLTLLERLPKKRLARSPSHPVQLSRSAESVF